jgi:sugar phosphate isomerase/epimerase
MLGPRDLVLSSGVLGNPDLEDLLAAAQAGGYRGLALWPGDYHPALREGPSIPEMRRMIDDSGIVLWDLDALVAWVGPDDPGSPYYEEAVEAQIFELADGLGAHGVNMLLAGDPCASLEQAVGVVAGVAERAAEHGLVTHLEFSRNRCTPDIPSAARLVEAVGRDDLGLMLDAWHVHWGPGSFADVEELAGERVSGVQLNDAPAREPDDLGWATRYQRGVPGEGVMDLSGLLKSLEDIGCRAPLCIEVFDSRRLERLGVTEFARLLADATRQLLETEVS